MIVQSVQFLDTFVISQNVFEQLKPDCGPSWQLFKITPESRLLAPDSPRSVAIRFNSLRSNHVLGHERGHAPISNTNALWTWPTRAKFALIHFSYKTGSSTKARPTRTHTSSRVEGLHTPTPTPTETHTHTDKQGHKHQRREANACLL